MSRCLSSLGRAETSEQGNAFRDHPSHRVSVPRSDRRTEPTRFTSAGYTLHRTAGNLLKGGEQVGVSQLLERAGKRSLIGWGVSWETPPAPSSFLGIQLPEGEGLKSGPWKGGGVSACISGFHGY